MDLLKKRISSIGFGAFKIGRNEGTKYGQAYDLPGDTTVDLLLNRVLDLGVTYIDTAPAYGVSEERIGRFLAHRRNEFILSTKVGETFENGQSTYDFSREAIHRSIERSLRRLRTDVLDIVFIHAPRSDLEVLTSTDAISTLNELRDRGLIRAVGLSGYSSEALGMAIDALDAIMVEYHPGSDTLAPVIAEAAQHGKIVVVKKGLASGRNHPLRSIEFVLSNPAVSSLVIGSMDAEHMAENIRIAQAVRRP